MLYIPSCAASFLRMMSVDEIVNRSNQYQFKDCWAKLAEQSYRMCFRGCVMISDH